MGVHGRPIEFQVNGWGSYVLKEKLKLITGSLKIWHKNHTQIKNVESMG